MKKIVKKYELARVIGGDVRELVDLIELIGHGSENTDMVRSFIDDSIDSLNDAECVYVRDWLSRMGLSMPRSLWFNYQGQYWIVMEGAA